MLVVVFMYRALGRADSVVCGAIQVNYLVQNAFFLKGLQNPVQGNTVYICTHNFFKRGLSDRRIALRDNLQYAKPRPGNFKLIFLK